MAFRRMHTHGTDLYGCAMIESSLVSWGWLTLSELFNYLKYTYAQLTSHMYRIQIWKGLHSNKMYHAILFIFNNHRWEQIMIPKHNVHRASAKTMEN